MGSRRHLHISSSRKLVAAQRAAAKAKMEWRIASDEINLSYELTAAVIACPITPCEIPKNKIDPVNPIHTTRLNGVQGGSLL